MNGRLIVLEGLDGSGKSTQFERLDRILSDRGISHSSISFPDYNEPSSALVKMYLNGEISKNAQDINAFAASSFYAVDRYVSYKKFWEQDYLSGKLILAARYVTSNAIYQMVKLPEDKWDSYIDWLCDYEYNKLGLPKPSDVVFLDMPIEISQRLMSQRYNGDENKKDIHEANVEFLKASRKTAKYAADKLGWHILECSDGEQPLDRDVITERLLKILELN
ncbi:MAG: deoxynucleoside kinase [Ruminococcus sp.]|nr:deoxynucleoside kinase [Ruminococcus sp.]